MKQAIILSFFLLIFAVNDVHSEELSLKSQILMGLDPEDIVCSDKMLLVLRSNENLACVYESTAEKLQWDVLSYRTVELTSPYNDELFSVSYKITAGSISNIAVAVDSPILNLDVDSWNRSGQLEILLPFGFISNEPDEDVFVLINNEEAVVYSKTLDDSGNITLIIEFDENINDIEIILFDLV